VCRIQTGITTCQTPASCCRAPLYSWLAEIRTHWTSFLYLFLRNQNTHKHVHDLLDRPFYERSILCFAHVSFLFFPNSLFPTSANQHFRNFSTWRVAYSKKNCCYADFLKVPPIKNEGETPKFRPILYLIATYYAPSLVMWKENRKSKTIFFIRDY